VVIIHCKKDLKSFACVHWRLVETIALKLHQFVTPNSEILQLQQLLGSVKDDVLFCAIILLCSCIVQCAVKIVKK